MSNPPFELDDINVARVVFGERDQNLRRIEEKFGIEILVRGTSVQFRGPAEAAQKAKRLLLELQQLARSGHPLTSADIIQGIRIIQENPQQSLAELFLERVPVDTPSAHISPKSLTQKGYLEAIRKYDIVFGWGPAGTGKTYLAMAMAVSELVTRQVDRIILARPAVEAGEKLGYLPGDLAEKVNPYLRPLYDALHDMMDFEKASRLIEKGVIEVAPLAFMRGRTLNKSFVILDEAQNSTPEQMKMFLTRLGFDSKAVVTGDITQVDLPTGKPSGLVHAIHVLRDIDGIKFIEFTERDVVRHPLVQRIITAYDQPERK